VGIAARACRHRLRGLGSGALIVFLSGCAVGRSAGSALAEGAVSRLRADTTLQVLSRDLADSTVARLGVKFASDVLDPATATWGEMRRDAGDEVAGMRRDVGQWVEGDLNRAVGKTLSDNSAILDERLAGAADATARAFTDAFAEALTGRLAGAADTLTLGLLRTLAAGIDSELRPTIHALMREVRDSLQLRIQDVDRTVSESTSLSGLRAALLGAGVVVLLAGLVVVVGHRRRQDRALHALIDAIDATGDDRVQKTVRAFAAEAGVHGWLSDRVASRRACRPNTTARAAADSPEEE